MLRQRLLLFLMLLSCLLNAQEKLDRLTVEKIMRDPKWIGSSPSNTQWSQDGQYLFFSWNPNQALADSTYFISLTNKIPQRAGAEFAQALTGTGNLTYNAARTAYTYTRENDVFYTDTKLNRTRRITQTTEVESNPAFAFNETKIIYTRNQNLYAWDISSGETIQLTNIRSSDGATTGTTQRGGGSGNTERSSTNQQENWLKNDQLQNFEVLKDRKEKRDSADAYTKSLPKPKE